MLIVIGGIKGGTGKSTVAFHLAVHIFQKGYKIKTFDIDTPQVTFTRYFQNRAKNKDVTVWQHHRVIQSSAQLPDFQTMDDEIWLVDTPGRVDDLNIELHKNADIIITPVNDSLIDIDTIMEVFQDKWINPSHYAGMIFENKKNKKDSLWFVLRNRSSSTHSKYKSIIEEKLSDLSNRLNFQILPGLRERVVFKELFHNGLTVMDLPEKKLTVSHVSARMEIRLLWKKIEEYLHLKDNKK